MSTWPCASAALPDSSLVATQVGSIRRVVCASPDVLAKFGEPHDPQALTQSPCVNFERLSATGRWMFRKNNELIEVPIRTRLRVDTAEAAIDAAVAGVGFVRTLSYQAAAALQAGSLRLLLEDFEPEPWPVHLVYPGQGRLPIKLRALLDFAAPRLRSRLHAAP